MSFSKSRVKRFNDISTDACAPPVGTYDPKLPESSQTSGQFSATPVERLKDFADGSCSISSMMKFEASEPVNRKNVGQLTKPNSFKHSPTVILRSQGNAKILQYEQEIKHLLMERSALLKQLTSKDEEGKKIYSRMQAAIRERSFFQASVATFEKENKELRRINEIYKIKFETFEGTYKKKDVNMELANLRAQLASKNHQISDLRMEIVCTREEQEISIMKLSDKYKDIAKISSLMIDAMEILKGEIRRVKDHIVKMQITEECAEEFYECISAQLHNLDEKMVLYQSSIHDVVQEKEMSDFNCNLQNSGTPKKLTKTKNTSDELSDDLSSSQSDEQDHQRNNIEKVMSSTLDIEHQQLPTAESYFDYLEKCRTEDKNDLKPEELNHHHLDKELSNHGIETLPKPEEPFMKTVVTELCSELQLVKDEYEKLKLELESCRESYISREASLEKQVVKAKETCELKTSEFADLNKTVSALSAQLSSLNVALKEEIEKTTLQALLSEEKSWQISNLEAMLQTAKIHETTLKDELATQLSKLNSFREEMSGKLQASEEVIIMLKNEINARETRVNYLLEVERLLVVQINLLTDKGNTSEQLIQKLTLQSNDLIDAMKVQESLLQKTKDSLTSCKLNFEENKEKVKEYELLIGQLNDELAVHTQQVKDVAKELAAQNDLISALRLEYETCQVVNVQLKEEKKLLSNELQNSSGKLISVKEELAAEIAKCDRLNEALNKKEVEVQDLMDKLKEALAANDRDLVGNHEVEELKKELLSWKNQCDELQAKIAPFQEQLDSYAIDRQMLMSKNMETISDLKALSLQYATSLGHQNRRQKIHYMFNLKEENFNLKEENGKLWADILKLRNSLTRDGPKTPTASSRIGSSHMPRSTHTPVNKENKDSGNNTPLRDCSNNDK